MEPQKVWHRNMIREHRHVRGRLTAVGTVCYQWETDHQTF